MITFGMNYDVKQEYVEQFLKVCKDVLNAMDQFKGHVSTVIYQNIDKPRSYMIYSEWETNEDFKGFMTSEGFKSVQNLGMEMLEERPKHKMYETRKMH
jgi:heme-degrading monooxygenase HmoA